MKKAGLMAVLCVLTTGGALPMLGCMGEQGTQGAPGAQGEQGPAGVDGKPGSLDPSISAVVPGKAFLLRSLDITISGSGTDWSQSASVDFGPNVKVEKVTVASPSAIVASVTVNEDAAVGPRDVSITDGKSTVTFKGAFKIEAPINVIANEGVIAQGSIFFAHVDQKDFTTPFDTTGSASKGYPNLAVTAGSGVTASVSDAQPYGLRLLGFADVDAKAGDVDLRVASGLKGAEIASFAPKSVKVNARAPLSLEAGTPATAMIAGGYDSTLYAIATPAKGKLLTLKVAPTATTMGASPAIALLPASGKFDDIISFGSSTAIVTAENKYYAVVWDNTGTKGYSFKLTGAVIDTDDKEPNDTKAQAQAVASLPATLKNLALSTSKDEDWFAVTVATADVGKSLRVVTSAGDPVTDTAVDVFKSDGTTSLGGPSADKDYHENFLSAALPAAGTYYVQVTSSFFGSKGQLYNLSISVE
jgi:Quinohemoprotein amine dehydrogenase, alpha subunit domain III